MPPVNKHQSGYGSGKRDIDITFDPGDFKPVTPYSEDLKDEYQEAQQALEELRHREELIRRRAEQLEEITGKEELFTKGRSELISQIEDYLDLLEKESAESNRIARECAGAHQRFHHHLNTIRKLRPEASDRQELNMELDHALRHIEAAEDEVSRTMPLIDLISQRKKGGHTSPKRKKSERFTEQGDFFYWLKAGFAFTLPIMMLIVALCIAMFYLN
ncbi:MAG: hypothetical protein P1V20_14255 [Verrucomicrobiales bacterium]|nr:hypothetical protein [Verrucomicrobiales bacterium]